MQLTEDTNDAIYQVRSYEPGCIRINDTTYHRSLILSADTLLADWEPQRIQDLKPEHWTLALKLKPDVLLLGTGQHLHRPNHALLEPIYTARLAVECMSTAAACRSYIALSSEGRRVVAALLIH